MSKIYLIPILFLTVSLTACGQKGALYLPEKNTSEMPNASTDTPNNPNDLPNSQNPNTKLQDSKHDY